MGQLVHFAHPAIGPLKTRWVRWLVIAIQAEINEMSHQKVGQHAHGLTRRCFLKSFIFFLFLIFVFINIYINLKNIFNHINVF